MSYESDEAVEHELDLYADNTSQLYPQKMSIIANIKRKIKSGKYDPKLAPKLWAYWYEAAAKRYCKEFGCDLRTTFPKGMRDKLAVERAVDEYRKIKNG